MLPNSYSFNVFINCPFDKEYLPLMNAMVFAIYDCGYTPRCALEENNSGNVRIDKLEKLIRDSKFGVHDLSRAGLDIVTGLPRFNMPLELGFFLGAKFFGNRQQKAKNCLILDSDQYRYRNSISDIAGHDIHSHNADVEQLIKLIRNWLHDAARGEAKLPGGVEMVRRFNKFRADLPKMSEVAKKDVDELTFLDRSMLISSWLEENPQFP